MFKTSVADPVHFFGSGSGPGSYLVLRYNFDVKQNKYFFLWHFLTISKQLMTLKIKN